MNAAKPVAQYFKFVLPAALLLFVPLITYAQTDTGSLKGIVTDTSGKVVAHAAVTVLNRDTNISTATTTNDSGQYFVPGMRPGSYNISVVHPGFSHISREDVVLQVGQTVRIDLLLSIGAITDFVQVVGEAPLIESETSDRGIVVDSRKIQELPLNGRDYNQLAQLAPGVLFQTPRLSAQSFKGGFSANGNRVFMNAFQLDGLETVGRVGRRAASVNGFWRKLQQWRT